MLVTLLHISRVAQRSHSHILYQRVHVVVDGITIIMKIVHGNSSSLQVKTGVKTRVKTGVKTGVKTRVKTGVKTRVKTGVKTRVKTGVKTGVKTRVKTGVKTGVKTRVKTRVKTGVKTGSSIEHSIVCHSGGCGDNRGDRRTTVDMVTTEVTGELPWTWKQQR